VDDRETAEFPAVTDPSTGAATDADAGAGAVDPTLDETTGEIEAQPSGDEPEPGAPAHDESTDVAPTVVDGDFDVRGGRAYLDDLDPAVDHPFPWSPDD